MAKQICNTEQADTLRIITTLVVLFLVSSQALGDFNGDGNLDAVFANDSEVDQVCLGDGKGGFTCSDISANFVSGFEVGLGDVNGDGNLDIIFASYAQMNRVCLGDGAGGFACADVSTDSRSSNGVALTPQPSSSGEPFQINAGLNDAWFNPTTDGQGFLITVFPEIKQIFLAWFTYDTERPPEDVEALLGEPGHRWLTAQGPYEGDTAMLDIFMTAGGIFDSAEPKPDDAVKVGTMTIVWHDCGNTSLTYEIDSPGVMGTIELTRIVNDNVALCEVLVAGQP